MAGTPDPALELAPGEFVQRLEPFERVLVELKNRLYEGSWERIQEDLRSRLRGEPYIYKLSERIARDIAAIEKLQAYEQRHKVDLASLLLKKDSDKSK